MTNAAERAGAAPTTLRYRTAAVFDLDGVLVDTARLHFRAWQRIADEFGFELDQEVAEAVKGVSRHAALEIVLKAGGIELDSASADVAASRKNAYYQEYIRDLDESELLPDAAETLQRLRRRGIRVALASASKNARSIIRSTGIEAAFDAVVDGTVVTAAKPDPAVFLEAVRLLGVEPEEAVVMEDAAVGIEGAIRAGCMVVGIGDREALAAADVVAPDLPRVPWTELFGWDIAMTTTWTSRPDLAQAPFNLGPQGLAWLENSLAVMSTEQKVGQVMCLYLRTDDVPSWTAWLDERDIEPGAVMVVYRPRDEARRDVAALQQWSRTPLLVAGNLESGAVNFVERSEAFANPMQVAATQQLVNAERLAVHCARIGNDIGVNWAFAPVIDVAVNPHNPITNTRTFGQDPEMVAAMGEAYIRTLEQRAVATSPKHFPGDGVDDRDQHLVTSSNDLSLEEWQRTVRPGVPTSHRRGGEDHHGGTHPPARVDPRPGSRHHVERHPSRLARTGDRHRSAPQAARIQRHDRHRQLRHGGDDDGHAASRGPTQAINAGCDMVLGNIDVEEDFQAPRPRPPAAA